MKLIRLTAPGGLANLKPCEEAACEPARGEVQVRIRATSLNYHDLLVVQGKIPCADGRIPMSDGAGEVLAVGEGVEEFQPGDQVVSTFWPYWLNGEMTAAIKRAVPGDSADGYAREIVCMPSHAFTRAPANLSPLESATLTCAGVTAWRGLVSCGRVKPGDTVLVQGTGGVSLFALQFAKAAGARVIGTSSSDAKLDKLRQLGADELINYKAEPNWGRKAKALTDGRGVDHVIEVGGPATLKQSITACRTGGHIALVGVLTGMAGEVSIPAVFSSQLRISGISVGSRSDQEDMIRAIEVNAIKPVLDRRFALDDLAGAFAYFESQQHFGKVCVEV